MYVILLFSSVSLVIVEGKSKLIGWGVTKKYTCYINITT